MMWSLVLSQYQHVTDRQMDGHCLVPIANLHTSIAECDKRNKKR